MHYNLPYGIVIETAPSGAATLTTSSLGRELVAEAVRQDSFEAGAVQGIERLLLAMAAAGLDVSDARVVRALETTVEALGNEVTHEPEAILTANAADGMKRVIAVVTFSDPDNNIETLSDAATWLQVGAGAADMTCYASARDAALDEQQRAGDFSSPAGTLSQ